MKEFVKIKANRIAVNQILSYEPSLIRAANSLAILRYRIKVVTSRSSHYIECDDEAELNRILNELDKKLLK